MVRSSSKNATVFFNGRPYWQIRDDLPFQTQAEIEALPTGGWGYLYFPKNVRFASTLGIPYMGMTARFHKSWADFGGLKPYRGAGIRNQPDDVAGGWMQHRRSASSARHAGQGLYKSSARRTSALKRASRGLLDAKPVSQIGLFQIPGGSRTVGPSSGSDEGAARMLMQLKHQFDLIDGRSSFDDYELIILPDRVADDG